jgi:integrase/recombinase XerD
MLTLYRYHKRTCTHVNAGRSHRHCKCIIWIDGILGGKQFRKSLKTRDWTKASTEMHKMELAQAPVKCATQITLAEAWTAIHADFLSRNLSKETIRKYKHLEKQMTTFALLHGFKLLKEVDLNTLTQFRATWNDGARAAGKKVERLRALFRFAMDRDWVQTNPAAKIKMPVVEDTPTMPLSQGDMVKIYKACDDLVAIRPNEGKLNAMRIKPLIQVMRYTGLRVSDAVTLTTSQINGNTIVVRQAKTKVDVRIPVPDFVIVDLAKTPKQTKTRYFWTGNGTRETVTKRYEMWIKEVFDLAGIEKGESNAMSHRLRDTFAVELLQVNTPIERVSKLLGHRSVAITEKHYAPWNQARQRLAEADVVRSWENDPFVNPKRRGSNGVQNSKSLPN